MGLRISIDLDDSVTFGDLYRFVDHARAAGLGETDRVTIERDDAVGNPLDVHALAADLGDVDQLMRPTFWLTPREVDRFTVALEREMRQESDTEDVEVLRDLLRELWAAQGAEAG